MNQHTDGLTKKRVIALLLLVSCITSILILVYTFDADKRQLQSFGKADSLIVNTLQEFNIDREQMQVSEHRVDSNLVRKTYTIHVPPRFSKTLLHAELNRIFHPFSVKAPARILLPEQRMDIHLLYDGTVFRTLSLRTDEDLILERDIASILVAFDEAPSDELVKSVIRFGEPIPIALRVTGPGQARERMISIKPIYPHICYWFEPAGEQNTDLQTALPTVSFLQDAPRGASVLQFQDRLPGFADPLITVASQKNITFLDVSDAMILSADLGETVFKQELDKFANRARRQQHPVAIVMAGKQPLEWLREKLISFKKSGLYLAYPPQTNY
ncbi:MAG: hypothetical protein U5K69_03115 [Balneolaceae bacterium]|nr:hypothetical protein [Balneolaceae bacterium]